LPQGRDKGRLQSTRLKEGSTAHIRLVDHATAAEDGRVARRPFEGTSPNIKAQSLFPPALSGLGF